MSHRERERKEGARGKVRTGGRDGRSGRPHPLARISRRWPASHLELPGSCLPVERRKKTRGNFPKTPCILVKFVEILNREELREF
jgi:hypothetical protein